jgi:hypothetical protein
MTNSDTSSTPKASLVSLQQSTRVYCGEHEALLEYVNKWIDWAPKGRRLTDNLPQELEAYRGRLELIGESWDQYWEQEANAAAPDSASTWLRQDEVRTDELVEVKRFDVTAKTKELCGDDKALTDYVNSWMKDPVWDLENFPPALSGRAVVLAQITDLWLKYWGQLEADELKEADSKREQNLATIAQLVAHGFTLDGLLTAALMPGRSIQMVVYEADRMMHGEF